MQRQRRAEIHAALGDSARLAIVDELASSDRSPSELSAALGLRPPLLAFHLDTLEHAGVIERVASTGDRRRKYVQLVVGVLEQLDSHPARSVPTGPIVFVCTRNSARSQLAAALWRQAHDCDSTSAGTEPAERIHPGAVAAAKRAGLDLDDIVPRRLDPATPASQIVTVCDAAHEELGLPTRHWSIPDPVVDGSDEAFDRALVLIRTRVIALTATATTTANTTEIP